MSSVHDRVGSLLAGCLDLLVDLADDRDLLDLIEFKLDLEDLLGCTVDVVTEAALSPYLRERILRECQPLWRTTQSREPCLYAVLEYRRGRRTALIAA
jgi:hypothetical protein